jgi:hypothetical protein
MTFMMSIGVGWDVLAALRPAHPIQLSINYQIVIPNEVMNLSFVAYKQNF